VKTERAGWLRRGTAVTLTLALLLACSACQWFQNGTYFLDVANPPPNVGTEEP